MDFAPDLLNTEKFQSLRCGTCRGWLVLDEASFFRVVDGIEVTVQDLPVLFCQTCDLIYLPARSKGAILHHVEEAKRKDKPGVVVTRRPEAKQERFRYCRKVEFLYDSTDYHYIPGLYRGDGFLTPVFFSKGVLLKYMHHPEYVVELGSDTYGTIWRNGEHLLPLGINRNGKVIMWLGDLDQMPEQEQYYLRSENVPSDHDIGSDFYLGQIEAVFTDYSKERELFRLRSEFGAKCLKDHNFKLNVYDLEVFKLMAEVVRPVTWGEREVRGVVEALNKILVESLNSDGLKKSISGLKADEDVKALGGMKLLQKWLGLAYSSIDAASALSPFFVLYDFRIVVAHLIPADSAAKKLAFCYERMGLAEGNRSYETLYDALIGKLTHSYQLILGSPATTP
jgi:hypothetical protein